MARREAINEVRPMLNDLDKGVDVIDKGLDAVEKAADVATDVVDASVHVAVEEVRRGVHWLRSPKTAGVVLLVATAAGTGFITWKLAKRHFTKKYEQQLTEGVEEARKFYSRLQKDESPAQRVAKVTADEARQQAEAEAAADALKEYQGKERRKDGKTSYDKVKASDRVVGEAAAEADRSLLVNGKPYDPDAGWDYDEELRSRNPQLPYVISKDEYFENAPEHTQVSITYYEGDGVLADEDDPMDNVETIVGEDNLMRFGHGSDDSNVVYVRYEPNEIDYEISRSTGKFSEEVLNFLQHSDRPLGRDRRNKRGGGHG